MKGAANAISRLIETSGYEMEIAFGDKCATLEDYCESPIELMLILAMDFGIHLGKWVHPVPDFWISRQCDYEERRTDTKSISINVIPQYKWEKYRIDFAIFMDGNAVPSVFIECDGHEFHERTPEQAERDRSKDRAAQGANIPILRFTGREIHRDPYKCAADILNFLRDRREANSK